MAEKTLRAWCHSCHAQTPHNKLGQSDTQVYGTEAKAVKGSCVECGETERYAVRPLFYEWLVS